MQGIWEGCEKLVEGIEGRNVKKVVKLVLRKVAWDIIRQSLKTKPTLKQN